MASFLTERRRLSVPALILIVVLHIALFYGLVRAFAPSAIETVERSVLSSFTVTLKTREPEPPPQQRPEPDAGAAGNPGKKATPKPVTAPIPELPIAETTPVPQAASSGTQNRSGARDAGTGTGSAGQGDGTGRGRAGSGTGGGTPTKVRKTAGNIASARDFPVPPGGRKARVGTSVTIHITVGPDGLPKGCRVAKPGPFPATNQRACDLAMQRFRFEPARDGNGNPVTSIYGWKQDFFN